MQILIDRDGIAILRTSETLTGDLSTQAAAATQVCPVAALAADMRT